MHTATCPDASCSTSMASQNRFFCVLRFAQLHQLMLEAYDAIGDVIATEHRFYAEEMAELDKLLAAVPPRVIPANGTLMWFTKEVSRYVIQISLLK